MTSERTLVRPCICGRFLGKDVAFPHDFSCLCGETLHARPSDAGWFVQHGPNPEHRSPDYPANGSLLAVCDWVDAVCGHMREGEYR